MPKISRPQKAELWYDLARYESWLGKTREPEIHMAKALKLDPGVGTSSGEDRSVFEQKLREL